MTAYPKTPPLRNQKLRDAAQFAPKCFACGCENNYGNMVLAHSNSLSNQKGMGQKADDMPAYMCERCHDLLDGRVQGLTQDEMELMHLKAVYASVKWLIETGRLKVVA